MKKAVFYHAGCPVCVTAEQEIVNLVDTSKVDFEIVHFGEKPERIKDAEKAGVKSVPALVLDDNNVLHINFGAALNDLKN